MADRLETVADVANVDETVEIPAVDTPAEIDTETCEALGARVRESGQLVPAPFSAALAMLEMVDSPFLTGGAASMSDLFAALYILHRGEEALRPIYAAIRTRRALERVADKAFGAGEAGAESWLSNVHLTSLGLAEFDTAAMRFGRALGSFDVAATVAEVREALHVALGGFRMFPEGAAEKKTDGCSMPTGSPGSPPSSVRSPGTARTTFGGRCRWLWRVISSPFMRRRMGRK